MFILGFWTINYLWCLFLGVFLFKYAYAISNSFWSNFHCYSLFTVIKLYKAECVFEFLENILMVSKTANINMKVTRVSQWPNENVTEEILSQFLNRYFAAYFLRTSAFIGVDKSKHLLTQGRRKSSRRNFGRHLKTSPLLLHFTVDWQRVYDNWKNQGTSSWFPIDLAR